MIRSLAIVLFLVSLTGCGGTPSAPVVFLGDSLTQGWDLSTYFPDQSYVNKGIGGQTTGDMLARLQRDVVGLHPSVVLIWGGVNDLPKVPVATTESNLEQLYQQSKSAGITVIACTLTPLRGTSTGFNPDVVQINHWIRSYANAHSIVLSDYYPAVVTSDGVLRSDYAIDVVHLNDAGYAAITPIARVAIEAAMGSQ